MHAWLYNVLVAWVLNWMNGCMLNESIHFISVLLMHECSWNPHGCLLLSMTLQQLNNKKCACAYTTVSNFLNVSRELFVRLSNE